MLSWFKKKSNTTQHPKGVPHSTARKPVGQVTASVATPIKNQFFIGRQPVLSSEQRIIGYELLFRSSATATAANVVDPVKATSELLVTTFHHLGAERVLGDKKAFINVSEGMLAHEMLELLPPENVVLELLEDIRPTPEVIAQCKKLQARGFQLALDDFVYRPELEPLLEVAKFIKLDIRQLGMDGVRQTLQQLRGRFFRIIAEKVENQEEFKACRKAMITYYQGYYFLHPETLATKRIDPVAQRLMHIFNMVKSKRDPKDIETEFKQDVALTYNLLRYINSAGMGVRQDIKSVKHALIMLGHNKLSRWISLLMFSGNKNHFAPQALFRTALIRARSTELLGDKINPHADHDYLFITGMFSLLDALLEAPMEQLVKNLSLPDHVTQALLFNKGPYAPFLELSRACENLDIDRIEQLSGRMGLKASDVTQAQLEAMDWAEKISAVSG